MASLLLGGSSEDPNLEAIANAARSRRVPLADLRISGSREPRLHWELDGEGEAQLLVNGAPITPRAAFLRCDVFLGLRDPRPEVHARALGWYQTLLGWLDARPEVALLNRHLAGAAAVKPAVLRRARQAGLNTAQSFVTNDTAALELLDTKEWIAKPTAGGGFCVALSDALAEVPNRKPSLPTPAIVQRRLTPPELRLYCVGERTFGFEVESPSLDYRADPNPRIRLVRRKVEAEAGLRRLMGSLGMDFGAADLKTDPSSGELVFLELNTSPMFARFDSEAGGALSLAIVEHLLRP